MMVGRGDVKRRQRVVRVDERKQQIVREREGKQAGRLKRLNTDAFVWHGWLEGE